MAWYNKSCWKHSESRSMREWINKMLYIHTMDYYAALKGNSNSNGFSVNSNVGRGVPNNSVAPAGCPTIQLNSDTIYQDITADPTAEGLSIISTADANHKFRCCLCFWPVPGYRLEVPTIPSQGLMNLLEWLTELRKSVSSSDYWFLTKDIKAQESAARWRDTQGRYGDSVWPFHAFPRSTAPPPPTWSSPNPALSGFCGGFLR